MNYAICCQRTHPGISSLVVAKATGVAEGIVNGLPMYCVGGREWAMFAHWGNESH